MRQRTSGDQRGIVHFINRVDETNAGDRVASPLTHYLDYFSEFQIKRHDIRYIDWDAIESADVVVLGGGGLFNYAEFINRSINRLLTTGAAVIGWSPGFNTHHEYLTPYATPVDFERFELLAVRDFENAEGIEYLPDVTCKLPRLRDEYEIKRTFGIAHHKDYPIPHLDFESISNDRDVDDILRFLGESSVIVSNSYHMIYWATLMGKKCLSPGGFSTKFAHFQHPPTFFTPGVDDLVAVSERAQTYDTLEQHLADTERFFQATKRVVEARAPMVSRAKSIYSMATETAVCHQRAREAQLLHGDMVSSNLVVDTGAGFDSGQRIVAIGNVYGDEVMHVRFDLAAHPDIQQIKFHPVEGWFCKVAVLSATSDLGSMELVPQDSVTEGDFERFSSAYPQYISSSPVAGTVEIAFRLERATEESVAGVTDAEGLIALRTWERDRFREDFKKTYQHLVGSSAQLESAIQRYIRAESRLDRIERSRLWRLSAPIRGFRRRLQRSRREV
jgi:hypothetical protein